MYGESSWPVRRFMEVFRRTLSWIRSNCAQQAVRLVNLHGRFADCFGRRKAREHALGYLRGLLLATGRKSVEPMAARVEPGRVQAAHQSLHHFVANADWSDDAVLSRVRAQVLPVLERQGPIRAWIVELDPDAVMVGDESLVEKRARS